MKISILDPGRMADLMTRFRMVKWNSEKDFMPPHISDEALLVQALGLAIERYCPECHCEVGVKSCDCISNNKF